MWDSLLVRGPLLEALSWRDLSARGDILPVDAADGKFRILSIEVLSRTAAEGSQWGGRIGIFIHIIRSRDLSHIKSKLIFSHSRPLHPLRKPFLELDLIIEEINTRLLTLHLLAYGIC